MSLLQEMPHSVWGSWPYPQFAEAGWCGALDEHVVQMSNSSADGGQESKLSVVDVVDGCLQFC